MLGRGVAWTPGGGKMLCSYAPTDLRIQLCTLVTAESLGNMDLPSLSVFPILLSPQFLKVSVGGFSMAVRWLPCNNLRIAFSTFPIHSNLRIVFFQFPNLGLLFAASFSNAPWMKVNFPHKFKLSQQYHGNVHPIWKNCQCTDAKDNPKLDICSLEQ